jgi:hypothetical protein
MGGEAVGGDIHLALSGNQTEDVGAAVRIAGRLPSSSMGSARYDAIFGTNDGFGCGGRLNCSAEGGCPVVGCRGCEGKRRWTGGLLRPFVFSPFAANS